MAVWATFLSRNLKRRETNQSNKCQNAKHQDHINPHQDQPHHTKNNSNKQKKEKRKRSKASSSSSMASTTRAIILFFKPSHTIPNHHHHHHTLPFLSPPRHLTFPPSSSATASHRRFTVDSALGGGGGGIYDTRKSEFSREFEVIATMLKRIEPLDSSDISKFVSESAKDSMKQTISTMLGILPSDQFSVSVRVSELPLHRLLVSSIITGYTLWNAEYRVSLMRNFDLSFDCSKACNLSEGSEELGVGSEAKECEDVYVSTEVGVDSPKQITSDSLKGLSPETLSYIEQLEAELCSAKQELDAQKNDSKEMDSNRGGNNNSLLQYLRSLESYMVTELSQPSSEEVKQVIHELVPNTIQKIFKYVTSAPIENTAVGSVAEQEMGGGKMFTTSRDYLAKLLFWCMLLGHHLRGLENRLHLSCVVGLL